MAKTIVIRASRMESPMISMTEFSEEYFGAAQFVMETFENTDFWVVEDIVEAMKTLVKESLITERQAELVAEMLPKFDGMYPDTIEDIRVLDYSVEYTFEPSV